MAYWCSANGLQVYYRSFGEESLISRANESVSPASAAQYVLSMVEKLIFGGNILISENFSILPVCHEIFKKLKITALETERFENHCCGTVKQNMVNTGVNTLLTWLTRELTKLTR